MQTQPKILSLELEFCVIVIIFVSIFINLRRQHFILKFEVDGIDEVAQSGSIISQLIELCYSIEIIPSLFQI